MIRLRIDPSLSSQQTSRFVTTDGTPVLFTLRWNDRSAHWFLDVTQTLPDGSATSFTGVKLTPNYPVLQDVKNLFSFPGDFILLPTQPSLLATPIGYLDLGTSWFMCWISDAEAASWRSANGLR